MNSTTTCKYYIIDFAGSGSLGEYYWNGGTELGGDGGGTIYDNVAGDSFVYTLGQSMPLPSYQECVTINSTSTPMQIQNFNQDLYFAHFLWIVIFLLMIYLIKLFKK